MGKQKSIKKILENYECEGQLSLFDMAEDKQAEEEKSDFTPAVAKGIKETCIRWGYNWILKIIENPTVKTFLDNVCKISNTDYFELDGECYGIQYSKKEETGKVYKCGPCCNVILEEIRIESIIEEIKRLDISEFHKPYDEKYLRFHISKMSEYRVKELKGLGREEFVCRESHRSGLMDIGNLITGQRIIIADDLEHRPELPHATWDDYIAMFKEVWGED